MPESLLQAEKEKFFHALIEHHQGIIALLDENFHVIFRSAFGEKSTGWSNEEMKAVPNGYTDPEVVDQVRAVYEESLANPDKTIPISTRMKHKNGQYIWLEGTVTNKLQDPDIQGIVVSMQDVTSQKMAEEKLLRLNRLYYFMSQMNQAIVKARNANALFREACRIAVEAGQFRMAWIGILDEATKSVIPVIHAGEEADYLSRINIISLAGSPESMGPGSRALREGTYIICNDIESAPEMAPWREAALGRNYLSSIGLPLKQSDKIIGLFSLYASKKDFFDAEETALLRDVANDISFALESFEHETRREKAEQELLQSKLRYQTLTETSPVGIFHTDAGGWTTYVNPRWCQISGMQPEKALGNGWLEAVHPDDRERLGLEWAAAAGEQRTSTSEYRFIRPDGSIMWVLGQAVREKGIDDEVIGYVGTITDITDLKRATQESDDAKQEVKKSEELYRRAEAMGKIGHWEWDLRKDFFSLSEEAYRITEIDSDTFGNRFAEFVNLLHPDDMPDFLLAQHAALTKEEKLDCTHKIITPKGHAKHIHLLGQAVPDEEGDLRYLTGTLQDITEQVIARNQIINERNLSDSIINSLPGVFYLYTQEGRFLRWNQNLENVTQYTAEEIAGMHPLDFFDGEEKNLLAEKIGNVFLTGEDQVQAWFVRKDKVKLCYYFTGRSILYEGKTCLLGVGLDFSDRIAAQEKIKETTQQLRELAAHLQNIREEERIEIARDIHDDLGQQLTAVQIAIFRLAKQLSHDQNLEKQLQGITDMTAHVIRSIRRISTQLRPAVLDDIGLVEAMKWQTEEFERRFSIPITAFFSDIPDNLRQEIAVALFRIYQETLTNIARHAAAAHVQVRLTCNHRQISLEVHDDGLGFDEEKISSIRTLGLLGMKERAHMIGGDYEISSQPGMGTSIKILIPLDKNN